MTTSRACEVCWARSSALVGWSALPSRIMVLYTRRSSTKLELSRFLDWRFVSCDMGMRKPSPEAFAYVGMMGCDLQRTSCASWTTQNERRRGRGCGGDAIRALRGRLGGVPDGAHRRGVLGAKGSSGVASRFSSRHAGGAARDHVDRRRRRRGWLDAASSGVACETEPR